MYACKDHDHCPLDLEKLRADLRALPDLRRARAAIEARVDAAREALRRAPHDAAARAALDAAFSDLRACEWETSRERATLLCSIRAHHRGRVHRKRMRLPTGEVRTLGPEE